jgi:hypothetical protein
MSYTIASLEDVQGALSVDLGKTGNKYLVGIHNTVTREHTHKEFDSMEAAYTAFEKIARCVCMGLYTEREKREMLLAS